MQIISLEQARELLERAQNPFFLYDNDADGFCSATLLRRWLGRGKSCIVRSAPDLDQRYASEALHAQTDLVVVLDRPTLGMAFVGALTEAGIPLLWIDHHQVDAPAFSDNVSYYNPHLVNDTLRPVTAICYDLSRQKKDLWIALMGCIADHYLPPFVRDFEKEYSAFWGKVTVPFDAYYGTEIGRLARAVGFGIKDSLLSVKYIEDFFLTVSSPEALVHELDSESDFAANTRAFFKRYTELYESALNQTGSLIFFKYSGQTSMSAALANELSYRNPQALVAVAYLKGPIVNLSLRGKHVLEIVNRILPQFSGASGGGHAEAVGVRIRSSELDRFIQVLSDENAHFLKGGA